MARDDTRREQPYGQVRAIPQIVDATYAQLHAAMGDNLEARGERGRAVEEWRKAADLLVRREESMKEMWPVLEAAGALNPEMDEQAADLLMMSGGRSPQPQSRAVSRAFVQASARLRAAGRGFRAFRTDAGRA